MNGTFVLSNWKSVEDIAELIVERGVDWLSQPEEELLLLHPDLRKAVEELVAKQRKSLDPVASGA